MLCSYWSFIVHILADTAEIGCASQHCRCTIDTYRWYIVNWTYSWRWSVTKWWQLKMKKVSCKVLTIANDNEKYKTHMFVILFIHYSSFCSLCLNVLYHSLITIGLITLKHFLCWFLYTVFVSICTSYSVMVVSIHICMFHYIYLLHIYYVIIAYL